MGKHFYFAPVDAQTLFVESFLAGSDAGLLLDVRSPGEYNHAHIPGAINLPLFSDEERAVVGTAYKQESRKKAIRLGLDFFGPKMRPMVEQVENLLSQKELDQQTPIFMHCWRGGMRSGAMAWLLRLYGFEVFTLAGGYKAYRNEVLQSFSRPYPLKLVGGFTGSGKTELLQQLKTAGEKVIDLEALASHKGSAFGNINMPPQPSQEMFENLLHENLRKLSGSHPDGVSSIWVEDESQRIGHINIPNDFWLTMRTAPVYFIEIDFEKRLDHIVEEYGELDRERLQHAITRISKRLGPLETKTALESLESGDIRSCFAILLHYYDKRYLKGLHNRETLQDQLVKLSCDKVDADNARLLLQPSLI